MRYQDFGFQFTHLRPKSEVSHPWPAPARSHCPAVIAFQMQRYYSHVPVTVVPCRSQAPVQCPRRRIAAVKVR